MQTQVYDRCASRYDSLVDTNWGALSFTEGECYVGGFVFIDLHSPFLEPVFTAMQMVCIACYRIPEQRVAAL